MDSHGIGPRRSQVTVRKTPLSVPFYAENDQFTKTGSGQSYGKVESKNSVCLGPPNHMAEGGGDNERPRVVLDDQGDLEWLFVGQLLAVKGVEGGQDAARLAAFRAL